jgi:CBS domain-containing protein
MQTLRDIIKPRDIYWVDAGDTVTQAVHYLCERKTGAVAVKRGDSVAGIFSERDLMHRVVKAGLDPRTTLLDAVMSTRLHTISLDEPLHQAKAMMFKYGIRHLLVTGKGDQFKGLVSMRDLMEADLAETTELVQRLNDEYYEKAYQAKWRTSSNRVIIEPYEPTPL